MLWTVVCWRLLRVPWTARANQSILKEINPECSLEGLILKLKLQYFGHLMGRTDSLEKTLMLGKIEGRRRKEPQMMQLFDGITDSMDMSLGKLMGDNEGQGSLACCSPWDHKELDMTERLNNSSKYLTEPKFLNKILANIIQQYLQRIMHHGQVVLFQECKDASILRNQSLWYTTIF